MAWPSSPDEFLALDLEQRAQLLLVGLLTCQEGERGRNFINNRLGEWFSDLTSGVGNPTTFPRLKAQRAEAKRSLDDAYALLESRSWIRPDPDSGTTFCEVTDTGEKVAKEGHAPDGDRVRFALRALEGVELHRSLRGRDVDSHFLQGKFETALRDGSTFLEDAIRTLAGLQAARLVGVKLASKAFSNTGALTDLNLPAAEQVGIQNLYMGFFAEVRNRVAHEDFKYSSPKEAFQALMLLDFLAETLSEAAGRLGKQLN